MKEKRKEPYRETWGGIWNSIGVVVDSVSALFAKRFLKEYTTGRDGPRRATAAEKRMK